MKNYRLLKRCRICHSKELIKYLDLGETPLANSLINPKRISLNEKRFPLEVLYCKNCSLSQLSIIVNPEIMFSEYVYRSSISKTFQKHCAEMAKKFGKMLGETRNKLVVDIASNDGCLLKQFKDDGFKVIGIEPARNIAKIANDNGVKTICSFWNKIVADKILRMHGKAKVITATNVLAHVDNLTDFLEAVTIVMDKDSIFMVEVPYLSDLIKKNEFDTIYHEHLSYFLVKPLIVLFKNHGIDIFKIEKYPIHGGSIRIYASKGKFNKDASIEKFLSTEKKERLYDIKTYNNFQFKVKEIKKTLRNLLFSLKSKNKKIAAYGASAKGNTLLNYCGIDNKLISFIIDDTPEKQNKLAPGSRIRIVDSSYLSKENPDYILLLAWNFAEEIIHKVGAIYNKKLRYVIPIPYVRLLN